MQQLPSSTEIMKEKGIHNRFYNEEIYQQDSIPRVQEEPKPKSHTPKAVWVLIAFLAALTSLQAYTLLREQDCKPYNPIVPWVPITYVWLGGKVPYKYQNKLKYSKLPYVLLTDQHWQIIAWDWQKYTKLKSVEKSDILRLLFVYNYGGIYSDFDVFCNYEQLFLDLPKKGCYFAGHADQPVYPDGITNSFIYCKDKGDPQLKQLLDSIRKNVEARQETGEDKGVPSTTGPTELRRHAQLKALPRYYDYCYHAADATWRQKK